MHNSYANFVRIIDVCKSFSANLVNELFNLPRPGVVPKCSDLEVIALNLTAEIMSIDSENYLFALLEDYRSEMPNLISHRQYNDRRKYTADLCERIRKRIVERLDGSEDIFVIDSKPVKVCQLSRGKRNRMGMKEPEEVRTLVIALPSRCITTVSDSMLYAVSRGDTFLWFDPSQRAWHSLSE